MTSKRKPDKLTEEQVVIFEATEPLLKAMGQDLRKFASKKPESPLSKHKVSFVNRLLTDLKALLANEPNSKYLDLLTDEDLPQYSDVVLVISQYEAAMSAFKSRYKILADFNTEEEWQVEGNDDSDEEASEDE